MSRLRADMVVPFFAFRGDGVCGSEESFDGRKLRSVCHALFAERRDGVFAERDVLPVGRNAGNGRRACSGRENRRRRTAASGAEHGRVVTGAVLSGLNGACGLRFSA